MAGEDAEPTELCHWKRLTPDLIAKIASYLHHNEVAVGLKLLDRTACACLRKQYRATLQLARELPRWLVFPRFCNWNVAEFALAATPWPAGCATARLAFLAHFSRPEPWHRLTLRQRRQLLCCAASSGDAASLELVLQHGGCHPPPQALIGAVLGGDVRACEALLAAGCDWNASTLEAAMREGRLEVAQFLVAAGCPIPGWPDRKDALGDLASTAARGGQARVLEWMESEPGLAFGPGEPFDRRKTHYGLVSSAAEGGHVELMEQLNEQRAGGNTAGPHLYNLESIAYGCPLDTLQRYYALWVEGEGWDGGEGHYGVGAGAPPLPMSGGGTGRLLAAAAASPTPDWAAKLDWIRSKRPDDNFDWIHNWNAARLATLQLDLLPRLVRLAAVGVDLEYESDLDAACVASAGHADALAYLLDHTSQTLSERVADKALTGCGDGDAARQLQTLQLIAERGFVFGTRHVAAAGAAGADARVVRWLAESVPADAADVAAAAAAAAQDGGGGAAGEAAAAAAGGAAEGAGQQAGAGGWSAAITAVAGGGGADLPLLRYLHEARGAAVDLAALALAGSEEALDWGAAARAQAGQPLPAWTAEQAWELAASGNRAALDWVLRRGLAPAWPDVAHALAHFRFAAVQAWLLQGGAKDRLDGEEWRRVLEAAWAPKSDERPDVWSGWQRRWLADCWRGAARARGGTAAEAEAARVLAAVEDEHHEGSRRGR